jgi:hypothetical protein
MDLLEDGGKKNRKKKRTFSRIGLRTTKLESAKSQPEQRDENSEIGTWENGDGARRGIHARRPKVLLLIKL